MADEREKWEKEKFKDQIIKGILPNKRIIFLLNKSKVKIDMGAVLVKDMTSARREAPQSVFVFVLNYPSDPSRKPPPLKNREKKFVDSNREENMQIDFEERRQRILATTPMCRLHPDSFVLLCKCSDDGVSKYPHPLHISHHFWGSRGRFCVCSLCTPLTLSKPPNIHL